MSCAARVTMHRAIAAWLTERPWRAAGAIAFFGALAQLMPPFTVFASAIPVLSALRFDARIGLAVAAIGTAAAAWLTYSLVPAVMTGTFVGIALTFFGPLALALLLKRTGSLNLCFQVAVLGIAVLLAIVHAVLPDPVAFWKPLLVQMLDSMQAAGIRIEGDRDALIAGLAPAMWGARRADARDVVRLDVAGSLVGDAAACARGVRCRVPEPAIGYGARCHGHRRLRSYWKPRPEGRRAGNLRRQY